MPRRTRRWDGSAQPPGRPIRVEPEGRRGRRDVSLHPSRNRRCRAAVASYAEALTESTTFRTWTLEAVLEAPKAATNAGWVHAFEDRYLGVTGTSG